MSTPAGESLERMPLEDLRACRTSARRAVELMKLRARQGGQGDPHDLELLVRKVDELTEELIARYAADLSLVDSLLAPAYPANVTPRDRSNRSAR